MKTSYLEAIKTLSKDCLKICEKIELSLSSAKTSVLNRWPELKILDSKEYQTIDNFVFYGRGLLIILIHTLESEFAKYKSRLVNYSSIEIGLNSRSPFTKSCEKTVRKLSVIQTMCDLFQVCASKLKLNKTMTYFNDDVDIDSFREIKELNVSDFMHEIGTQYVPTLAQFYSYLVLGTASHSDSLESSWRDASFITNNIYYFFNSEEASQKTNHFFKTVDAQKGKSFWNFHEREYVKPGLFLLHDKVDTSLKFRIPREEFAQIGDQEALQTSSVYYTKDDPIETVKSDNLVNDDVPLDSELRHDNKTEHKGLDEGQNGISMQDFDQVYKNYQNQSTITKQPCIECRLISPYKLDMVKFKTESDFPTLEVITNFWKKVMPGKDMYDETKKGCMIFHIHGGGFVAMSTFAHESYLRKWAILTGLPIVSIDYKKSPEAKYPLALEECFTAYKWVLEHSKSFLNSDLKKIIVAGDSAGGNLSLSLTQLCIKEGVRVPDALAISYPASYLTESPSPARLTSLIDPLVNYSFLKMCGDSYLKKGRVGHHGLTNSLISPCIMPDEMLKQFPPTYLNVGTLDPLFDDAIVFSKRLQNATQKVKLDVYDGLGHGYLNMLDMVQDAKVANARLCGWINRFLSEQK